jgi:hypothetical protein
LEIPPNKRELVRIGPAALYLRRRSTQILPIALMKYAWRRQSNSLDKWDKSRRDEAALLAVGIAAEFG